MFFNDINVQRRSLLFADRADFPLSRRKQGFESPRERQLPFSAAAVSRASLQGSPYTSRHLRRCRN